MTPGPVLLDTCAVIWLANGQLKPQTVQTLIAAGLAGGIYVSPVSAWEIGLLAAMKRPRDELRFQPDAKAWFAAFMAGPAIKFAGVTPGIAIDSNQLPGPVHGDPADRLLIATARDLRIPLITRDRKILAYAGQGLVEAIPC